MPFPHLLNSTAMFSPIFNIVDNIQMVDEFEEDITLDDNNVKLSDFPAEQDRSS